MNTKLFWLPTNIFGMLAFRIASTSLVCRFCTYHIDGILHGNWFFVLSPSSTPFSVTTPLHPALPVIFIYCVSRTLHHTL